MAFLPEMKLCSASRMFSALSKELQIPQANQ
jgi:hypothetical protein